MIATTFLMKKTGIYKIINIITGKVYVGSAVDIDKRWGEHLRRLNKNNHHSITLQRSFNKHSINSFNFEIIEECLVDLLIEKEQYWINHLDSYRKGYNCSPTAGSPLGVKRSDELKKKLSIIHIGLQSGENHPMFGKNHSEESKRKISESLVGRKQNPEISKKRNENNRGKKRSDDFKKSVSERMKGKPSPRKGKKLTDEHIRKLSEAAKNRKKRVI
jgi:group I intron endonuclease